MFEVSYSSNDLTRVQRLIQVVSSVWLFLLLLRTESQIKLEFVIVSYAMTDTTICLFMAYLTHVVVLL